MVNINNKNGKQITKICRSYAPAFDFRFCGYAPVENVPPPHPNPTHWNRNWTDIDGVKTRVENDDHIFLH